MNLTILGSTGSIGVQTLDVIRQTRAAKVVVLAGGNNVSLLIKQALEFKPKLVVAQNQHAFHALKEALSPFNIEVATGRQSILEAASYPSEYVMSSIVGFDGLAPTLCALKRGAIVLLANKESLVCGGILMRDFLSQIIPVDSEHNAIFQILHGLKIQPNINKIILTASGGPFLRKTIEDLQYVTPEESLKHPNWTMGKKISIDSATMMNKALELIEAFYLFQISPDQLEVIIHPQSIVHAIVSYVDGSYISHMGAHDMRIAIAYALNSNRMHINTFSFSLFNQQLTFESVNDTLYPAIQMAYDVLSMSNSASILFNAANEEAVDAFLEKKITFLDIMRVIDNTIDDKGACTNLDSITEMHDFGRKKARAIINRL